MQLTKQIRFIREAFKKALEMSNQKKQKIMIKGRKVNGKVVTNYLFLIPRNKNRVIIKRDLHLYLCFKGRKENGKVKTKYFNIGCWRNGRVHVA